MCIDSLQNFKNTILPRLVRIKGEENETNHLTCWSTGKLLFYNVETENSCLHGTNSSDLMKLLDGRF